MTHRIVCIGDTHLIAGVRRQAKLKALDQIISEGLALTDLAMWAWPGDVFHSRSSAEDRNDVAARLQVMGARAPILVVAGNHDQPGDLDIFAKVKAAWPIYVVCRPMALDVALATGGVATVACVPYPHKGGLVALNVSHQDLGTSASAALDGICIELAAILIDRQLAGDTLPLLLGHATIKGSLSSVGQPMGLDHDIAIDAGMLARFGSIPKIFNHIHKPQEIFGAHYLGSITAMDWGETERKRYLVAAYEGDHFEIESHELDTPALYHVEGELTRESFKWELIGDDAPHDGAAISWKGCEVRVRYRFAASEKTALSTSRILAEFADAKRLELQPVAVPDKALRAPEVAAAVTLPEKFIKFCELGGAEATPGMLDKLAQVEQTDPVLVLRAVASAIAEIEAEDVAVLV